MRSISSIYKKFQKSNPYVGSYICLASVITAKKFSRKSLVKALNELLPTEEYSKEESKGLVDHLEHLTNTVKT